MIRPRSSISTLMAIVAILAADLGAIRAILDLEPRMGPGARWISAVVFALLGGVPMANLLGLVAWVTRRDRGRAARAFLVVGGASTAAYLLASVVRQGWLEAALDAVLRPIDRAFYPGRNMPMLVAFPAATAVLVAPLLLPALIAAALAGPYRVRVSISIERRRRRRPILAAMPAPGDGAS